MNNDLKIFLKKNWKLILGLLYMLSPLDLIPDILPVVGTGDDAIVAIITLVQRYMDFKKEQKLEERLKAENIQDGELVE